MLLSCLDYTGADGVLSAVSLLENPSLFTPVALLNGTSDIQRGNVSDKAIDDPNFHTRKVTLFKEYLELAAQHPVKMGLVRVTYFPAAFEVE